MKKFLLAALLCLSFFGLRAQTLDPNYIDGHLYFKFVDSYDFQFVVNEDTKIEPSEMKQYANLFDEYGVTLITRPLYAFNDPFTERVIRLEFTDYTRIDQFIRALEALPEIEYAERVPLPKLFVTYNDPLYSGTWTLYGSNYGPYQWNLTMINAEGAWAAQVASSDIKVAVVDGAVWGSHPDLGISTSNQCSFATGTADNTTSHPTGNSAPPTSVSQSTTCTQNQFNGTNGQSCPSYDWSHGTHCAGMVAAKNNNGVGISSIGGGDGSTGSGLTLMGVRAADNNDNLYYCSNGVAWAVNHGARVVSMSYGGGSYSYTENNAYQTYANNGVVLVAAAGNDGDGDNNIEYPAGYSSVISVASVDNDGKLSYFSQNGSGRADIAAPGGFYNSTYYYSTILSTTYCINQYNRLSGFTALTGQYYDGMQGTSMACPTVAGLCGLMLSAYPEMTPSQVKSCLQSTAHDLASGSNTIDGNGYINALAAVNCAKDLAANLRVTPTEVTIASGGGSQTVEVTSATALTGSWTASSSNSAFTVSPSSGAGSGATTNLTITAAANETGAPILGTITITQGNGANQQSCTVSVRQNDQSDLCIDDHEDLVALGYYYDYITTQSLSSGNNNILFAERFVNTVVGTVDSVTFPLCVVSGTAGGNVAIKLYNDNGSGYPGTAQASKTISIASIRSAGANLGEDGRTLYGVQNFGVKFNTPVTVTGNYYVVIDFSNVTETATYTYNNQQYDELGCNFGDIVNQSGQESQNNALLFWDNSSNHFTGSALSDNINYWDIAVTAHFCQSNDPYVTANPSTITVDPLMGVEEIAVSSNTDWTASSSCDWITLSQTSGSDDATVSIVVAENMGDERSCTVTFTCESGSSTVTINQLAHQSGCDETYLLSDTEFGWRFNDAQTAYQWDEDSIYLYASRLDNDNTLDSGFVMGTNRYGDKAKANFITVYGTANITDVLYYYSTSGTGGSVTFKIWDGSNGTPGAVLASKTVTMSELSSSSYYYWQLDNALDVTGSIFVGADISAVSSGSYIGFWHNSIGASPNNYAWEQMSEDDSWVSFESSWGYTATAAMFPSICYNGSHVNIDLAVDIYNADTTAVITSRTLNAGESLTTLYRIANLGDATYTDTTKIYVSLDDVDLTEGYLPPLNFYSNGYFFLSDTIATMAQLSALGYHHNDVLNLCYRVAHTNTSYEWVDADNSNNTACLAVTINCPPVVNTITEAACVSYTLGSVTYNESGTYRDTLVAANGCDSIVNLNLTINQPTTGEETVTNCGAYTWNNSSYTNSGDYDRTFLGGNAHGCDSTATLHLTVHTVPTVSVSGNTTIQPGQTTTLTASGADSYVWTTAGSTVSTTNTLTVSPAVSTTYTIVGTNAGSNCEGTATVTVIVTSSSTVYDTAYVAECDSYTWYGTSYNNSGTYTYAEGNNVHVLVLTLNTTTYETDNHVECDSYNWHGTTYTSSNNTAVYNTTGTNGCPLITTLNLTINQSVHINISETACDSYQWDLNGNTYNASGSYAINGTAGNGCDSIVTLNLTINNSTSSSVSEAECMSYQWYGTTYTQSGSYTHTQTNAAGCPDVITLNLTIIQPSDVYETQPACDSYLWTVNGQTYTQSGQYQYLNTDLCSNYHLDLTINHSVVTNYIDSVMKGSAYSNHGFNVTASETAAATVGDTLVRTRNYSTVDGCDSNIVLHLIITGGSGIDDAAGISFSIYPNPASTSVEIDCENISAVRVYDMAGRMLSEQRNLTGDKALVNVTNFAEGSYVFAITTNSGAIVKQKVVVKH